MENKLTILPLESPKTRTKSGKESRLRAVSLSEGIARGVPFFFQPEPERKNAFTIAFKGVDEEIARYRSALFSSREDLKQLHGHVLRESEDVAHIIESHIHILDDPLITEHVEDRIREERQNPEAVFQSVVDDYKRRLSQRADPLFQERLADVKDLAQRVLQHLSPSKGRSLDQIPYHAVILARELFPSHIAACDTARVCAFVAERGGPHSHVALMAKAQGIPYLVGVDIEQVHRLSARCLIVDGFSAELILNPKAATRSRYDKQTLRPMKRVSQGVASIPKTVDGHAVTVAVNIGDIGELAAAKPHGPQGIGLLRSEYVFFKRPDLFSSEQGQYVEYVNLIQAWPSSPLVIRVFDVGGDKTWPGFAHEEVNPLFGLRGIRFLLRYPALFRIQLRALLRAAGRGDIRILLPFVTDVSELLQAKKYLQEEAERLRHDGVLCNVRVPVGCMIELPSAALTCEVLIAHADFVSVGTNDLAQYTLGIDRNHPVIEEVCASAHPSLIRLIQRISGEATKQAKPLSVCGEMASHPLYVPLLIGMGIDNLSCAPSSLESVQQRVRSIAFSEACALARRIMQLSSAEEVLQQLQLFASQHRQASGHLI